LSLEAIVEERASGIAKGAGDSYDVLEAPPTDCVFASIPAIVHGAIEPPRLWTIASSFASSTKQPRL